MGKLRTGIRALAWGAVLCILVGAWGGCTPQKRYRVLSFFFDGVPNPDAPAAGQGQTIQVGGITSARIFAHKPYADGKCGACHKSDDVEASIFQPTETVGITSNICLNCHGKVTNQYRVMHGPVALGECLICHVPHESSQPALLAAPAVRVCGQCHIPELTSARVPEHVDRKTSCTECHFGHGGPVHNLLRPIASTRPSTRPAAMPTTAPSVIPGGNK